MPKSALTGTRIRERRTVLARKQAELAREVGISASYLNLIEHNRRKIGGKLLLDIARALEVEASALTQGAEAELLDLLGEAAVAEADTDAETDRVDEFVGRFPGWANLIAAQQRRVATLDHRVAGLADRLANDPYLAEALHEVLSKVSAVRSTASILHETQDLDEAWRARFLRNLDADSGTLAEAAAALAQYLDADGSVELSLSSPQEELEDFLNSNTYHIAGLEPPEPASVDVLLEAAPQLRTDEGRALARSYLETYRADAQRLPIANFAERAAELSYDPSRLALDFSVDLPTVFRRLASLPAAKGQSRIGLVVCDGGGALLVRKPLDGFPVPRLGAACALWPLFQSLTRPMQPIRARLTHSSSPGRSFLAYAISEPVEPAGFDTPVVYQASMLLLPEDLVSTKSINSPVQIVGSTCRICPQGKCPARREASVLGDGFDSGLQNGNSAT